jgi:hypothetical protein
MRQARICAHRKILHLRLTMLRFSDCPHLAWEPPIPLPTHWLLDGNHLVLSCPWVNVGFKSSWKREALALSLQILPRPHHAPFVFPVPNLINSIYTHGSCHGFFLRDKRNLEVFWSQTVPMLLISPNAQNFYLSSKLSLYSLKSLWT